MRPANFQREVYTFDHRDRALVTVAYDTLCRSEELVSIDIEHLHFESDGSATVLIARSKTDQEGEGATAYLAPATVRQVSSRAMRKVRKVLGDEPPPSEGSRAA